MNTPAPRDSSRLHAFGWAAFLACSWTWCIGMYLPVLMIRDYGGAGWIVFAAPNVVGAAALGWVLQRPEQAANLARQHWHASVVFSLVTILFHAFFVGWIVRGLIGDAAEVITVAAAAGFYLFGLRGRRDLAAAGAVFGVSVVAFIVATVMPSVPSVPLPTGSQPFTSLLYLPPACSVGFLLCPYLDLTFLRARASTASLAGVAAFTIGFGVLFVVMIFFTMWYAPLMQPNNVGILARSARGFGWVLAIHMMLQTAFTVALHTRAIAEDRMARRAWVRAAFALALLLTFLLGVWGQGWTRGGASRGELIYRLFLAFYGLLFPAYVWTCMVPKRGRSSGPPQRANLLGCLVTVAIAGPMYWLGFINGRMVWLLPGVAVVVLSRWVMQGWIGRDVGARPASGVESAMR